MLTTERYNWANKDWEDQSEDQKIWANWKTSYKKAHAKTRVKTQASEGSDKFGAANASKRVLKNSEVTTNNGRDKVGMKALEGYFDNLDAAATNKKLVIDQLVANNANLTATNKELGEIVKKLSNKNKDLQRETYRLEKKGGSGATQGKRDPTL